MGKKSCILFEKICYECGMIQIVRKARDWTNLKASPSRGRPRNGVFNKFTAPNGDHLSVRRGLCPSLAVAS